MRLKYSGIPFLETQRLVLRAFEESSFPNYAKLLRDPVVMEHIGGKLFSEEEAWRKYMSLTGSWLLLGFGYWDVFEKHTDNYVGLVGFCDYHRDVEPSLAGRPEIGWVLARKQHRKGYATEAARAAMDWGVPLFGDTRTVCIMDPDYPATKRVATKCGFEELAVVQYAGQSNLIMEHRG